MKVTYVDLAQENKKVSKSILRSFRKSILSSDFILGEEVAKFEKEFASFVGSTYCIGVASGTDAILLSLMALGITREDEVIAPAFTFTATVTPILLLGAKPVLVDTLPYKPLIDPQKIEEAITKKTKAIIVVHLYGMPCDIHAIQKIAKKYKLPLIEDAAQAHGSMYKDKHVGTFGMTGTFSFYPAKNLGAFGDAGAIVTSQKKLAERLMILRNHGQKIKNLHQILGINSRLDTLQAIVLREKLKLLPNRNAKRRKIARLYQKLLQSMPVKIFSDSPQTLSNYHIFAIQTDRRDELQVYLQRHGIGSGIYYPKAIHMQPFYQLNNHKIIKLPFAEKFSQELLALPMYPYLTVAEIRHVVNTIQNYFHHE